MRSPTEDDGIVNTRVKAVLGSRCDRPAGALDRDRRRRRGGVTPNAYAVWRSSALETHGGFTWSGGAAATARSGPRSPPPRRRARTARREGRPCPWAATDRGVDATLGEEVLDIAVAQGEPEVSPDRMLDDRGQEAVTDVGWLLMPPPTLPWSLTATG